MKNKICNISLLALIMTTVSPMVCDAKVTVKNNNRSYADAYNQVAYIRDQAYIDANTPTATTASATDGLPVRVADQDLAKAILSNTSDAVSRVDLDACAMIFPSGEFQWAIPQSGIRKPQNQTCVAVVNLVDANSRAVLATTTVAAGDAMKCNIDMFPESGRLPALESVYVPNDNPPTLEDVEKAMNEEQKQNAGLKIAAGAIISGLAGNLLAPKKPGDDKLLGTSKDQLLGTAVAAAGGAGIMAASTYSGKVAGDTIKSTAVNAAAGAVVGNMAAGISGTESVMSIAKCSKDGVFSNRDCVTGDVMITKPNDPDNFPEGENVKNQRWFIKKGVWSDIQACKPETTKDVQGNQITILKCQPKSSFNYTNFVCKVSDSMAQDCISIKIGSDNMASLPKYIYDPETKIMTENATGEFVELTQALKANKREHAYAIFTGNVPTKGFGYKVEDFDKLKDQYGPITYYYRNTDGSIGRELTVEQQTVTSEDGKTTTTITETLEFKVVAKNASDGGLIDMTNEARAKGTMAGAGVGGAMGGFSAYQGARQEISDRYLAEKQAYDDSLSNFACMTGGRFLAKYNDYAEIPELKKSEQ